MKPRKIIFGATANTFVLSIRCVVSVVNPILFTLHRSATRLKIEHYSKGAFTNDCCKSFLHIPLGLFEIGV